MKSCPTCNRTFEDTFTFCLIDGSVLSAPLDPHATLVIPEPRQAEPPPIEVLKLEETRQEIPQTIASPQLQQKPEELVSTITAPAPTFESPQVKDSSTQPTGKPSRSLLTIVGVGALLVIGLIVFIVANRTGSTTENSSRANTATTNTTNMTRPIVATSSNSNQTSNAAATPIPTLSPTAVISLEDTVWEGLVDDEYQRIYEFKTGGKVIEKVGGKVGDKSPMSTHIGSWTLQGNRVSMKFRETKYVLAEEIEATIQGDEMTGDEKWKDRPNFHDTIRVRIAR
jgi:hypothetical protein